MKTNIKKLGDLIVVTMDGKVDYETQQPLKHNLKDIIQSAASDHSNPKIIFDLENLQFVGSSSISSLIQTLRDFNAQSPVKPRYCNVNHDLKRVIQALDEKNLFDFYDTTEKAKKSYDQ